VERLYPLTELLVLRAQAGDVNAYEALARIWQPLLLAHARRLSRGFADGAGADWPAEAVQDAWVSIARGLGSLDDPRAFGGWAMRIVARRLADRVRGATRRRRERDTSEGGADRKGTAGGPRPPHLKRGTSAAAEPAEANEASESGNEWRSPAGCAEDAESRARLGLALAQLGAGERALLTAYYGREMSVAAIAAAAGVREGTVKSRLHRVRRKLKAAMERTS